MNTTPKATPSMGTSLFTTTSISAPGTELFRLDNPPLTAVLNTARLDDTCAGCYRPSDILPEHETLKACTRCRVVRYCGKKCQLKDWRVAHALECPIFARLHPRILPSNVRAVLRAVLRYHAGKCGREEWEAFLRLSFHRQPTNQKEEEKERDRLAAKAVKEYSGTKLGEDLILSFFARLNVNSFTLTSYDNTPLGLYLSVYAALINHSCAFNAVAVFDGDRLTVRAIRPLAQGEQVFVAYVDTTYGVARRRRQLADRYFFECECEKCRSEMGSTEAEKIAEEQEKIEEAGETLINSIGKEENLNAEVVIQRYESAIKTLDKKTQPDGRKYYTKQPFLALRNELILALISAGRFTDAWLQSAIEFVKIDPIVYPARGHPTRRIHAWRLVKLTAQCQENLSGLFNVDAAVVLWRVLRWLVDGEKEACSAPMLQGLVRDMYNDIAADRAAVEHIQNGMRAGWAVVEELVERVLRAETE